MSNRKFGKYCGLRLQSVAPTALAPNPNSNPPLSATVPRTVPNGCTEVATGSILIEEMEERPATRLWFGVKPEGLTYSEDGNAISFAHVATRVYAAGSKPLQPGEEEVPAEGSRRVFYWWADIMPRSRTSNRDPPSTEQPPTITLRTTVPALHFSPARRCSIQPAFTIIGQMGRAASAPDGPTRPAPALRLRGPRVPHAEPGSRRTGDLDDRPVRSVCQRR